MSMRVRVVRLVFGLFLFGYLAQVSKAECDPKDLINNEMEPLRVCGEVKGINVLQPLCAQPNPEKTASVLCRRTSCRRRCNLFNFTVIAAQISSGFIYQCEAGDERPNHCSPEVGQCESIINTLNCGCTLERCAPNYETPNYCNNTNNTCSCTPRYGGDDCRDEICEIGDVQTNTNVEVCESPFGELGWFPLCPSRIHSFPVLKSLCRSESTCKSDCNTASYTLLPPNNNTRGYEVMCNDSASGLSQCELSFGNCTTGVLSRLDCYENSTCECENGGFCIINGSCLCPSYSWGINCEYNSTNESLDQDKWIAIPVILTAILVICILLCCCVFALGVYIKTRPSDLKNLERRIIFTTNSMAVTDNAEAREDVLYASVKLEEMLPSTDNTRVQNRYCGPKERTISEVAEYSVNTSSHSTASVGNEASEKKNRTYTEQTSVENDIYKPVMPKCVSIPESDTGDVFINPYDSFPTKPLGYSCSIVKSNKQRVEKKEGDTLNQGESYFSKCDFEEPPSDIEGIHNTMSRLRFREISPDSISLQQQIGTGCFGMVHLAGWRAEPDTDPLPVAVKCLKENADSPLRISFLTEAAIMGQFDHPNVLRLLGVVSIDKPYMLVVELMEGDLSNLLVTISSVPFHSESVSQYLLAVTRDVVRGMEYLSSKHFVHRDLAARNILVGSDKVCRIGDFGLSKRMDSDKDYYKVKQGGMIAVRWTAPEALFYRRYSEKSDVWSLGMTLFEVWSLGQRPWGQHSNTDVISLFSNGTLQGPPTGCPYEMYSLMVKTWQPEPTQRPTFRELAQFLEQEDAISLKFPEELKSERAGQLGNDPELSVSLFPELRN